MAQKLPPRTLPPIVPIMLRHSERGCTAPTWFQGLFDLGISGDPFLSRMIPNFEVVLDDITHRSNEELCSRGLGPFGSLALLFLRDGRKSDEVLSALTRWADLLRVLLSTSNGRRAVEMLLKYLSVVTPELSVRARCYPS